MVDAVRPVRVGLADGYQLTLRMEDGTIQRVTQDSPSFRVGDRVEVTPDGRFFKTAPPVVIAPVPVAPVTVARAYRPGVGTVESASVVSLPSGNPAAAGGTAGAATNPRMAYRLKMLDGTMQDVVQDGERFELGEQVRLTADGRVVRP
jgi:outer membrane lipoprotein SlyB